MALTFDDINQITMRYICNDKQKLAGVLIAVADDEECIHHILSFCEREGIDVLPAIKIALQPSPFMMAAKR